LDAFHKVGCVASDLGVSAKVLGATVERRKLRA